MIDHEPTNERTMNSDDVLPFLLRRHPEFAPRANAEATLWVIDPPGHYTEASWFVDWLHEKIADDDQDVLRAAAASIETLLERGDEGVDGIVVLGILESLTNRTIAGRDPQRFERLAKHLGPRSVEACREVDRFWGTRTNGVWSSDV